MHPLHMLSDQPYTKLHSQLDHSSYSLANKVAGRESIHIHPDDAARRDVPQGDVVQSMDPGLRRDDNLVKAPLDRGPGQASRIRENSR